MNTRALVSLVVVGALALTGCGSSDSGDDPTPSPTSSTTISPSPDRPSEAPSSEDPSPSPPATRTVEVFFSNDRLGDPCEEVFAVSRQVPAAAPLRASLEALLQGPSEQERADGYGGWFGPETEGLLRGVRLEDTLALVSFDASLPGVIPNASTSCGSTSLLTALDATATQFPEVEDAWYDLEGDRAAFYGWLQYAAPDDAPAPPLPEPTPEPSDIAPTSPASTTDPGEWKTLPSVHGNAVALTFDAGANGDGVGSILQTLADEGAPGTFFLTGRWVSAYPQLAAAVGERHAVGNHSQSHPDMTTLSDAAVVDEVRLAEDAIAGVTGDDPRPWFRFPYGARDERTRGLVADLGYRSVGWTIDTLGWQGTTGGQSSATVVRRVLDGLRPGAIVLMHVGSHPQDGSTLDADALEEIIREVRDRGYTMVDLDTVDPG